MAKRRKIRRGRKKKVTYQSSESQFVFGLISLFIGIICFISNFSEGGVFDVFHNFFGGATVLFGISFLVLALRFFKFQPERITNRTIIGLFLLSVGVAVFQSGKVGMPLNAKDQAYKGSFGGIVGFSIAEFIGDALFQNAIRPLMVFVIFISIPFILSITIPEYFAFLKKTATWIWKKIDGVKKGGNKLLKRGGDEETEMTEEETEIAKMYGDLQRTNKHTYELNLKKDGDDKSTNQEKKNQEAKSEFIGVADGQTLEKSKKVKTARKSDDDLSILMQEELNFPNWQFPPIDLLDKSSTNPPKTTSIEKNIKIIEKTLNSFGIEVKVADVLVGPTVAQYALNIPIGTKVSKIMNLKDNIALALATSSNSVRIEAPIPGTSFIGIEVPNKERQMIGFRETMEDDGVNNGNLSVIVGKNVSGEYLFGDIQEMPHLLIAGATGSGKSVVTNSFIMTLLMKKTPDQLRLIMVDPKKVELSDYNGIPHLLTPVITDMDKVNNSLKWALAEMENRYTEFTNHSVRNIEGYNKKMGFHAMPYIVIVIDEMADMMMTQHGPEIESSIVKLAQKARATGIHLILATQRPSVNVITGLIKANIPARIGMSVTSQVDSRVILDQIGAESLLGKGDMLFKMPGVKMGRLQGPFVSQKEVVRVVDFIKKQTPEDLELDEPDVTKAVADPNAPAGAVESSAFSEDELFAQAARIVVNAQKGSSSLIQRKLSIGYNRAARLLDELEEHGVVGPAKGSKPRDILIHDIESFLSGGGSE